MSVLPVLTILSGAALIIIPTIAENDRDFAGTGIVFMLCCAGWCFKFIDESMK